MMRRNVAPPVAVELLGLWPGWRRGPATDIQLAGSLAYLTIGEAGFRIYDVSDPTAPRWLGTHATKGYASSVAISGTLAFVVSGNGLEVIDVSNPAAPVQIGGFEVGSGAMNVVVAGACAYVLSRERLQIPDVSDPAQPKEVGNYPVTGSKVEVAGPHAYVVGGYWDQGGRVSRGFLESSLKWSGGVETGGVSEDVAVSGPRAYLADGVGGLRIIDVSDPRSPRLASSYGSNVRRVAAGGQYAYLAVDTFQVLEVIDIRNPRQPARTARISLPLANHVAWMGNYACVTGEGLQVFDLADPHQPARVGSHQLGSETRGLQVVGNLAYVAAGDSGLAIYRLTPQLRLNSAVLEGDSLRLSWLGGPGLRLQTAASLPDGNWQDVPGSEGERNERFYRAPFRAS